MDAENVSVATGSSTWRRVAYVWAVGGLAACLALGLASYLPFLPPVPIAVVMLCALGIFPTFGGAVIQGATKRQKASLAIFEPGAMPWRGLTWFGLVVVFGFVSFLSGMAQLPGQPEAHGQQYYFNNHGSLEPTDHAGYERGLRAQNRIFTSIPAVFYVVAIAAWRREPDDR